MDIKQDYREESNLDVYAEHSLNYANYTNEYVKWLEAKLTLTDVSKCLNEQTLENINNIMWESHMIKSKTFDKTQGTMIMQELEKWAGR